MQALDKHLEVGMIFAFQTCIQFGKAAGCTACCAAGCKGSFTY